MGRPLGMNRIGFLVWIATISGILNVFFSIYLVGYTSLGIIGIVIPPVILAIIRRPIVAAYTAKVCRLSPWRYLADTYTRPLVVLLFLGIIASATRIIFQPGTVFSVLACLALTAAAWFPLCWFIGLDALDRKSFHNIVATIRGKAIAA